VKADAYGHGAVEVARRAVECGVDFLAVATPDEALYLRNQDFQTEILVLGATPASFLPVAQKEEIAVAAISLEWLQMAAASVEADLPPLKIHLKVDTGMRRVGVLTEEAPKAIEFIRQHPFEFT